MQKIEEQIKKGVYYLKFYDENLFFPFEKKRINVILSNEAIEKLKGKNRSLIINELVLKSC